MSWYGLSFFFPLSAFGTEKLDDLLDRVSINCQVLQISLYCPILYFNQCNDKILCNPVISKNLVEQVIAI